MANSEYSHLVRSLSAGEDAARHSRQTAQGNAQKLQSAYLREQLAKLAVDPMAMSPKEFDALVAKEIAVNAALVKMAGRKPERRGNA